MQLRMKLGVLAMAGASALLLTGGPALASSHATKSVTAPEVIAGAVHGKKALANVTAIPLSWRGLVGTRSVIVLGGGGVHKTSMKTLQSPAGNLTVRATSKPQARQSFDAKTCLFTQTEDIALVAVGSKSTGAFAGASGPAAVQIYFAEYFPRYKSGPHKGQCNTSNNAMPLVRGAVASFLATAVLTVK